MIAQACVTATEGLVAHFRDRFAEVTTLGGRLAEATRQALDNWVREVRVTLDRVLADSPVLEFAETEGLAQAVSAGFLGLTLFESVNPEGSEQALAALEQLAVLVDVFEGLGPVATRAVRAKLRKAAKRS
ncbi:hypothetical protein [Amycolatopsis sp. TNS106]|uniref:hypothetical protein n=1 Tax=Amycolatopsis sp. TNS106 TaxID=2861750 RepID=UPI002104520D|nr:hypothetical protein [Amycolatopsis sp. TNS106]